MYLSNKIVFDGRVMSSIYYIRYNYMFRRLTMAIFRLYMKYLVSSYSRLNVGCILTKYFMYNLKMANVKRRNM